MVFVVDDSAVEVAFTRLEWFDIRRIIIQKQLRSKLFANRRVATAGWLDGWLKLHVDSGVGVIAADCVFSKKNGAKTFMRSRTTVENLKLKAE